MTGPWLNPVSHAISLIDSCGSLEAARELARMNAMNVEDIEDGRFMYWISVRDALIPEAAKQC